MQTAAGETIKQLRESAGLSRSELAQEAGISQVFLTKLEQGERRPSPRTLVKLAEAMGLSISDLTAKIAIFAACAAPTDDEMRRGLMRAATIGGAAATAHLWPLVGGIAAARASPAASVLGVTAAGAVTGTVAPVTGALLGAAAGPAGVLLGWAAGQAGALIAARRMQHQKQSHSAGEDDLAPDVPDVEEVRKQLLASIQAMPAEQLTLLINLVEQMPATEGGASSPAGRP